MVHKKNVSASKAYMKIRSLSSRLSRTIKSDGSFKSSIKIGFYIFVFFFALYILFKLKRISG